MSLHGGVVNQQIAPEISLARIVTILQEKQCHLKSSQNYSMMKRRAACMCQLRGVYSIVDRPELEQMMDHCDSSVV